MTFMSPLKQVTAQEGLPKGLGLKLTSATQAIASRFCPSHGPLINLLNFFFLFQTTFSIHMPLRWQVTLNFQGQKNLESKLIEFFALVNF